MSQTSDPYLPFVEEGAVAPSDLTAYLPPWTGTPDLQQIAEGLRRHERVTSVEAVREAEDGGDALAVVWGEGESALELRVYVDESVAGSDAAPVLTPDELDEAERSDWCLTVSTYLGEQVLADFHTQLKVLSLVAPDAVVVYDYCSFRFHSGRWLREVASSRIPPPPDTLYTVHAITEPDRRGAWLHSHGLHRCGSIELEMFDIPADDLQIYSSLFNVTAALFIEQGPPESAEVFDAGHELSLYWLPWEEAMEFVPDSAVGGRNDRDDDHNQPSGVLFAAPGGVPDTDGPAPRSVTAFHEILAGEPVMYHTQMETQRMSLLAKHRFPRLRAMHRRFPTTEEWRYHVKLGYQVDDCPDDEDDNEHLWFDMHEIQGGEMVATLINEPYRIARMHAGDLDRHPVDQLSDWTIDCPHGVFDPSSIGQLEALVDRGRGPAGH